MKQLEEAVRTIQKDGLVWGASTLVAIGFGIKKLQITLVIGAFLAYLISYYVLMHFLFQRTKRSLWMSYKMRSPSSKTLSKVRMSQPCKVRATLPIDPIYLLKRAFFLPIEL